jgi:hypothetical protein
MYGTNGIVLNSDVYTSDIYPYFSGTVNPPDLNIHGRTVNIGFGSYNAMVGLSNVKDLSFESSGFRTGGAITGLSSINGDRYFGSYTPNPSFSTITMNDAGVINTSFIRNTTANDFNINQENPVGRLTLGIYPGGVQTGEIELRTNGEIGLNNIVGGDGIVISPAGVLEFQTLGAPKGEIVNVSTINGQVYPPPGSANFVEAYQIYVSPNGSDSLGNGSQQNPYQTIARAITARIALAPGTEASIILSSGVYAGGFTLTRNTYLVGVQTGENRQPCTINGTITMGGSVSGNSIIGLSGLEINGAITMSGTLGSQTYVLFGCNITENLVTAIQSNASLFMTECRVFTPGAGGACINAEGFVTLRDCIIITASANPCINAPFGCSIRQCFIQSNSVSATAEPIIKITGFGNITSEISYSRLSYGSSTTDSGTNKCCIQFNRDAGSSMVMTMFACLLQAPGATFGTPQIQCIQNRGAGTVSISYGSLSAGTAHHIAPSITKTVFTDVV